MSKLFVESSDDIAKCWKEYVDKNFNQNNNHHMFCSIIRKKLNLSVYLSETNGDSEVFITFDVFRWNITPRTYRVMKYISIFYDIGEILCKKTLVVTEDSFVIINGSETCRINYESRFGTDLLIGENDLHFFEDIPEMYELRESQYICIDYKI